MNFKIFAMNLVVPLFVVLVIAIVTGTDRVKKKESIKGELFEYFKKIWQSEENNSEFADKQPFFQKFFALFVQAYEYEHYKEDSSKTKFYFYKLLVLLVLLSIPFLMLFLINRKDWILSDSEWNDIYLYAVILVPVIFAYLVNKYIKIKQYHETWFRHMRNRHYIEWRMISFIKDYEMMKEGLKPEGKELTEESVRIDFINDMCEYWRSASDIPLNAVKDVNIFEDIGNLLSKE
ncbi:MAG: hypothetical protein Q4C20_04870 [Erysipelotrichaceae bacterium]|nr:hypothetical protein [Erysipelotrichaceae bacterium]